MRFYNKIAQCDGSTSAQMWTIGVIPVLMLTLSLQPWWQPFHANDFQRWLETVMLAAVGIVAAARILKRGLWRLDLTSGVMVCALLLFGFLNPAFSDVGLLSWVLVLRYGLWGLLLYCLLQALPTQSDRQRLGLAAGVLGALSIYALYVLVGLLTLLANSIDEAAFVVVGFSNINHAAAFLMLAILWLPALAERIGGAGWWARPWAFLVGSVLSLLLFVIGSRGSFLAGACALSVVWLLPGSEVRRYLRGCLACLAGGLVLYAMVQLVAWRLGLLDALSLSSLTSDSGRYFLWQFGLAGFLDAPWLGHGGLSYAALPVTMLGHPHNIVIQLLYEFGAPFTLAILAICLRAAVVVFRRRADVAASVPAVAACAVAVDFAVHSQFSGLTMIPASMVILALALADGLAPVWCSSAVVTMTRPMRAFAGSTVLAASLAYVVITWGYWNDHDTALQKTRFWVNGGTAQWAKPLPAP